MNTRREKTAWVCYPELFDLGLDVALREVLDVGQLEVHLRQPHQDAVAGCFKLLPLADEVLEEEQQEVSHTTSWAVNIETTIFLNSTF